MTGYDFDLKRPETGGIEGMVRVIALKDHDGRLAWSRDDPKNVQFSIDPPYGPFGPEFQYRKWRVVGGKRRGAAEKGVFDPSSDPGPEWSQDGFEVSGNFPGGANLPLPCLFDVDLSGEWKLSLNVTRNEFLQDERLIAFRDLMYPLFAKFVRQILEKEKMLPVSGDTSFVDELLRRSPAGLRAQIEQALDYSP